MRKIGAVIFVLFTICFLISNVAAQSSLDNFENAVNKGINSANGGSSQWDYLAKEWKNILLKNQIISSIDSFLKDNSVLFEILLGVGYSLSFAFFYMILVWFYLLFNLSYLLKSFFSKGISWVMSFLILLILARTNFFSGVIFWTGQMFIALGGFIQFLPLLILIFLIIIWFLLYYFENFGRWIRYKYIKKTRLLRDKQKEEDEAVLHMVVSVITKAITHEDKKLLPAPKERKLLPAPPERKLLPPP